MLHRNVTKGHFAVAVNSLKTGVLVQLGEDQLDEHVQIRLVLTVEEVDDMIALLQTAKAQVTDGERNLQ